MSANAPIRILTVDDHPVVREGIAGLVGTQPDLAVAAEAANGREAIQQFRKHRPDVTLMDIQMPEMNGLDALIAIRTEFPEAKVVVLTTYEGDVHILRALKAGAQGYLLKNTLHSELLQTIRAVHAGKRSLSPEVSFQVAQHMSDQTLTPAEVVVLRLIAAGNANKEIADQLAITEDTVKGRVKSILAKLDAGASPPTHWRVVRASAEPGTPRPKGWPQADSSSGTRPPVRGREGELAGILPFRCPRQDTGVHEEVQDGLANPRVRCEPLLRIWERQAQARRVKKGLLERDDEILNLAAAIGNHHFHPQALK